MANMYTPMDVRDIPGHSIIVKKGPGRSSYVPIEPIPRDAPARVPIDDYVEPRSNPGYSYVP